MNFKLVTLGLGAIGAFVFGRYVAPDRLAVSLTPLITVQTIMAAAVLVRLNRGMPTIDWKSVAAASRVHLTGAIVAVTREYATLVAVIGLTLSYLIGLSIVGEANLVALEPTYRANVVTGLAGFLIGLTVARMVYVVWRDVDIVVLQKTVVDESGTAELGQQERDRANAKVEAMRSARLQGGSLPPTVPWND